ncbi:hypothetical protein NBRC10512_005268 [Rhodotorula toruloides]|uniref:RHTO0S23e01530g1_1 n=2 Tax=Rhodotorula toruloides TaxID=5286 RepID=A0A061BIF6_RHOTO|nr:glycosyltransferase family 2 protein [Rhodotorula toruloides NP11]EMS18505.1 glycosyltransferase family 2 protein [Rhodotorula toruloides NP11]KAJ8294422.1 Cellulose synthase catalytic subunit [UDP-forming] [Rhodotorula toruloides]CDR49141.1 RHTO0S23e01530g1_1 [Rhodotorula toruloides]
MPPKSYQRPKNPPRYHSADSLPPPRSTSPIPPVPPMPPSTPPPRMPSPAARTGSPTESVGSSPGRGGSNRTSRKPVPVYDADELHEPRLPSDRPRPTNPNPFAAANALIAQQQGGADEPRTPPRGARPVTPQHKVRRSSDEDELSPTDRGERAFSRGSTSPTSTPPHTPVRIKRDASAERAPPVPTPQDEDDIATLNFNRRPSQFDPLAPSFHHAHGGSSTGSRQLVSATGFAPLPPVSPLRQPGQAHKRQRSSHTRQPSISLSSPSASPSTGGGFDTSTAASSATSTNVQYYGPSTLPPTESRKILPLQPAAQRNNGSVPPTRAPIEAFASVEMLQGQREHQDRTRGTEVFGPGGTYEGRASSLSGEAGLPPYSRRQDPLAAVHAARNPAAAGAAVAASQYSLGSQLPPLEMDVMSIASQLREHDKARRGSEDVRGEWPRRFSEASSCEDESPPPTAGGMHLNPTFSFPSKESLKSSSHSTLAPAYDGPGSAFDDDEHKYPPDLKKIFNFSKRHDEKTTGGWRTEHLGASDKAFTMQRPSIVALPVYPSPGGTLSKSFKTRAKKWGTKVAWLTVLLACASSWVYLYFRYDAMKLVERKRPGIFVGGWCYLALETIVALMTTVHSLWVVFNYRARSVEPKMRLRGDNNLPSVDVFIVSSGQADQTVFDCAVAAASMDYPPHRYRVMVLDPTASSNLERELQRHAKAQACPHLTYHRRDVGAKEEKSMESLAKKANSTENKVTKANAINFGMHEASTFGIKGPAEFIAVFDADMLPERNYLRAVLPHILGENKVGLVKTRHGFINLPHRLSQPTATLLTASETPADTRSGFLLRRAAVTEIGGFPADSWIHDGQCEALLQGRGYKVRQVEEVLQWGMAKPTYTSQINAMMVNRLGPLRTAHRLGWFVRGNKTKLMPFVAKVKAIGRALLPIFSLICIILAYVYPFMFSFGGILVLTPSLSNLNRMLQVTLIMILLHKLHEVVWCWSTGLPSPRRAFQAWIFAAPYQGFALLRLILPRWLGGYKQRTSDIDINEVITHPIRDPWYKRLGWFVLDPLVSTMFAFLGALGIAIWRIVKDYERGTVDEHQTALTVLLTIAWPTLLWSEFLFASFVPFVCLLFPSRLLTEPRESFLIRDHYSHVARPKHHFKTAPPFKVHRAPEFVTGTIVVAWAIVCVCVAKLTDVLA